MAFFDRPVITGIIWVAVVIFGIASYTTLLKREGFPSVNIPITIVSGTYFVNDPAKVDSEVAKPISEIALAQADVKSVQTQAGSNFFTASLQYDEGTDAKAAADKLKQEVEKSGKLPPSAQVQYSVPNFGPTGGDIQQIDVAISMYDKTGQATTQQLAAKADAAAAWLRDQKLAHVKDVFVKSPYEQVTDPASGMQVTVQKNFDRYGEREGSESEFHNSVIIGVSTEKGTDVIKIDKEINDALARLQEQPEFKDYETTISASFAPSIKENLGELQRVLIEGLLAVLVVGSLVIAVRASIITVISMITVLLGTLGFLLAIGYSLNVITLFALILGLALIVDDTIIMVEAIDAARKHLKDRRQIVLEATRKISKAMLAATVTAALSFAPLIFVGGILGEFIRAIPVTLISALIISWLVALIFIPFFSRFLLLGKKQLGKKGVTEVAAGFEAALAKFITRPMTWAKGHRGRLVGVILTAVIVGTGFFAAGIFVARNVVFNIFPPTKDTNGIVVVTQFAPGLSIEQATALASKVDALTTETLGDNFEKGSYFNTGDAQGATLQVELKPYDHRDIKSPELVKQLQEKFDKEFQGGKVVVGQLDVGPPSAAFTVQIESTNREAAFRLANDVASYLKTAELKRVNNTTAHLTNVQVSSPAQFTRTDGTPIVTVSAGFDANDTTTLVTLAQDAVKKEFPEQKVASYGVSATAIKFDIGQESENQDSFKTLALAFPILLIVMYVLLGLQFRSFLQPLLIFLAIPFSIFGVMLGLDLTKNAISFFTMLGFFALVGLSIKNTILLTDYANQARRHGMDPIGAAVEALQERFRPLFATSMTAVVSLIPLAIASPFWEGLAVVLICGLLCSTLLVVTVFPYYYLGAEYLRIKVRARTFLAWVIPTIIITVIVASFTNGRFAMMMLIPIALAAFFLNPFIGRRATKA